MPALAGDEQDALPLPAWMVHLNRMSGKSVTASRSITPQALSSPWRAMLRPMDWRTLCAPSQPATYLARTVTSCLAAAQR